MDIVVTNLEKHFGDKHVLQNFNARFPAGETTCIMGKTGCGKTTLLRILMGLEKPDAGSVSGVPRRLAAVFQEDRLCEEFSAVANIRLVTGRAVNAEEIERHLMELGLADSLHGPVRELSGGMRRRVALARAVLARRDAIFLDEAFKGLDAETRRGVVAYFQRHTTSKTVISITHDPAEVALLGGRLLRFAP